MPYLYHKVPANLTGHILYPLNRLKDIYPDIYAQEAAKYDGRKGVMAHQIPLLGCLWNDALHFSPVHPKTIKDALKKLGCHRFNDAFFQFDADAIPKDKAVIYKYRHLSRTLFTDDFEPYDPARLDLYDQLPADTTEYFKEHVAQKTMLFFYGIPHILVRDSIDVSTTPIIKV